MSIEDLKKYTNARIALGRVGVSLPTKEILSFLHAHAKAKDSLSKEISWNNFQKQLETELKLESLLLPSEARNLTEFLTRPDKGRNLSRDSVKTIINLIDSPIFQNKIVIAISDGLSSLAISQHAIPFLRVFLEVCKKRNLPCSQTILLTPRGRVAIIDDLGEILHPTLVLQLIGERPGLSSPDSMGAYITYRPEQGFSDANRNCISNIRTEGQIPELAAHRAIYLIESCFAKKLSGVSIKDEFDGKLLE